MRNKIAICFNIYIAQNFANYTLLEKNRVIL